MTMEVEDVQKFCKSFPGIREDIKWGDNLCLMAGEKIFCMISLDAVPLTIGFKTDPAEFEELINQDNFIPAPYLAKSHWVLHKNMKALPATQLKNHLAKSYGLVVSKMSSKAKKEAGIAVSSRESVVGSRKSKAAGLSLSKAESEKVKSKKSTRSKSKVSDKGKGRK